MKTSQALLIGLVVSAFAWSASGQGLVRLRDDLVLDRGAVESLTGGGSNDSMGTQSSSCADVTPLAWSGQSVPGGGTLSTSAYLNPATLNASGAFAFVSSIDGVERNQGIFVADGNGLNPIAIGCGGSGGSGNPGSGCGDPTPIGGTFSGFFRGTVFAPPINSNGDVLFLSEVDGGSSPRGLFLYRAATADIVKIAAVGDTSPTGEILETVGPGSLNDRGQVAFLAGSVANNTVDIFLWENGVVTKVVGVGDPSPDGGNFVLIGTESFTFSDGTQVPIGPVPAINEAGHIAFRAHAGRGKTYSGHFLSIDGTHQLYVRTDDPTPIGGSYTGFFAPVLNEVDQIAFFADVEFSPHDRTSGWFVGAPGDWRKALVFGDSLAGGTCSTMAVSRNPMTPLDSAGNLLLWGRTRDTSGVDDDVLFVSAPDGHFRVMARKGEGTPLGGSYGSLMAWPSMNDEAEGTICGSTPGAPDISSAYFRASDILTWRDLGFALAGTSGEPKLTGSGSLEAGSAGALELTNARPSAKAFLLIGFSALYQPVLGGTLVPSIDLPILELVTDSAGELTFQWEAFPGLPPCTDLYCQFWIVDPAGPQGFAVSNGLKGATH